MLKLEEVIYSDSGRKIEYQYSYSSDISKFFNRKETYYVKYEVDVSVVPRSINTIPFLASMMPIAWFVGFDVYVDELDETFYNSLKELKE